MDLKLRRKPQIRSFTGILCGANEIKTSVHSHEAASLKHLVKIIGVKGDAYGIASNVKTVELKRIYSQIDKLFAETKSKNSPFEDGVRDEREDKSFTANDGIEVIIKEINSLGYDLSDEDNKNVYDAFVSIAAKKETVSYTAVVIVVCALFALFFWAVDTGVLAALKATLGVTLS